MWLRHGLATNAVNSSALNIPNEANRQLGVLEESADFRTGKVAQAELSHGPLMALGNEP